MFDKSFGFIGGGRVTRILLHGWKRAGHMPARVVVSDINKDVLTALKTEFPEVTTVLGNNQAPAQQDLVFVALHPPAIKAFLDEIRTCINPGAILISLAPKLTTQKLANGLGGFERIVRMIPNAPSHVNAGYNPVAYAPQLSEADKAGLKALFAVLGECPEVAEDKLEAYAILTAMGPTYLWFQLYELQKMVVSFGLTPEEVEHGTAAMVTGAIQTMLASDLSPEGVMDLIPVKPLGEDQAAILSAYHARLEPLYQKLKS